MPKYADYFKFIITLLMAVSMNCFALEALKSPEKMRIDGLVNEVSWQLAKWQPINSLILGDKPSADDFSGQFKVMWDEQQLYLLVEITDDVLFDQHADPRHLYWDDDCLEIFLDEDASGGNHQFNFNAFAYHVALDNQAVDIGEKNVDGSDNFVLLNDHITSVWRRSEKSPNKVIWEVSVRVYDDNFTLAMKNPVAVTLFEGKKLGFMLAYCDNDGSKEREHFIGSTDIKAVNGSKNLGYITADVFQKLRLIR
ncbi:sugar-binding protein [Colwellia demingiae]|uniref:Sugar-binding protein n=1 Tax=Colwellia demingiae TaxID=89401 RepID=A0A5C6QEU5_9GAMM|nr:sugar-binding protein [Colwellia demingiae]TWX67250.1 sugar-binding protein [Colwellia demingiae]